MQIEILNYSFDGPFTDLKFLLSKPGVYVVLDRRSDGLWYPLDAGESETIKDRIETHDRSDCWLRNQKGTLGVAALYTTGPSEVRRGIEKQIRNTYSLSCGIR